MVSQPGAPTIVIMAVWNELRVVLARLGAQDPRPLRMSPDPRRSGPDRVPPFTIHLAGWATEAAAELHERFGSDVILTVGSLGYPLPEGTGRLSGARREFPAEIDPGEVSFELDGPLSVRSGDVVHHGLLITNRSGRELRINTNGTLSAGVVDLGTGEYCGGYSGFVVTPLRIYQVAPGATELVPLMAGTDSSVPRLGYTVPPGRWGLQATLDPAFGDARRTPVLPFTITPRG